MGRRKSLPGRKYHICQIPLHLTRLWTWHAERFNDPAEGEKRTLWHVMAASSLPPSSAPVFFCFSAGPGIQECVASFLVSGRLQTFGYRGATYRAGPLLRLQAHLTGSTLVYHSADRPQLHFPALLVHHHHRQVTPTIHSPL